MMDYDKIEAAIVTAWLAWPFVWMAFDFFREECRKR